MVICSNYREMSEILNWVVICSNYREMSEILNWVVICSNYREMSEILNWTYHGAVGFVGTEGFDDERNVQEMVFSGTLVATLREEEVRQPHSPSISKCHCVMH